MPHVEFTANLQRHAACPPDHVDGTTVREALEAYFERHPGGRGYVLDELGAVRRHVVVFQNGEQVRDRTALSDPILGPGAIHVMQALSGG